MPTGFSHIHRQQFLPLAEALLESSEPTSLFDEYQNKDFSVGVRHRGDLLRETLIAAIADCLNHDKYNISTNAAALLRKNMILCNRACDLDLIVTDLTNQVNGNSIQAAKEAALALAFFLSTRPSDGELPRWGGSDPMTSTTMVEDLDQSRFTTAPVDSGYLHKVSPDVAEAAIEALIKNLNRPKSYRSSNWTVANECAKAIGAIGYQRPMLVEDSVPVLLKLLDEQDKRQPWLIYALTSIGYSQPNLINANFASNLEKFVEDANFNTNWQLRAVANVGYRKMGHSPTYLETTGCDSDSDLSMTVEKLYKFMLGRYPSLPDDVTQAFASIYQTRSDTLVELLTQELEEILSDNPRSFEFPNNFMLLLKELAKVNPAGLKPLLDASTQVYQDSSKSHYWYDNALELHRFVASKDENLLPEELEEVVTELLQSENRHSVQIHGRAFLQEIGEWDENLFSSSTNREVPEFDINELKELDDFDVETSIEEIPDDDTARD